MQESIYKYKRYFWINAYNILNDNDIRERYKGDLVIVRGTL